jgi:proton-coupled amino acid transporter
MCLVRNISKFSSMHFLGDLAILATVFSLAYESIYQISHEGGFHLDGLKFINTGWAKLLGMSITSLEGIGVILPIKESMKDKKRFNSIIIIGTFIISLVISGFPLIMYFCYQDTVNEIVLNNLPLNKVYIQVVLIMLMFSILIVYPVTLFPAFKILENLFCKSKKRAEKSEKDYVKFMLENILRVFIVTLTIVVGVLSINRFDTLLSLCGCGICTPVALIFPSVFHFNLYKKTQSSFRSIVDISIAVLGCSLSITVLIFTLI